MGIRAKGLYELYGLESGLAAFASPKNLGRMARATAAGFGPGRMEGTKTRIPGDFLIDEGGVIHDLFYGEVIADHIPFERVDAFVSGVAKGAR
ncbi:MAG: AhpC/TSA family protein [Deltaproteobacteria bacterium]|nr:AhpC/TSA family protein [Deltaproteobacteria bacterium]